MEAKVKFKDPGVVITIAGQKFDSSNLTQENYDYLVAFNESFKDYFVELENKIQPIVKSKADGKAKEPDGN